MQLCLEEFDVILCVCCGFGVGFRINNVNSKWSSTIIGSSVGTTYLVSITVDPNDTRWTDYMMETWFNYIMTSYLRRWTVHSVFRNFCHHKPHTRCSGSCHCCWHCSASSATVSAGCWWATGPGSPTWSDSGSPVEDLDSSTAAGSRRWRACSGWSVSDWPGRIHATSSPPTPLFSKIIYFQFALKSYILFEHFLLLTRGWIFAIFDTFLVVRSWARIRAFEVIGHPLSTL